MRYIATRLITALLTTPIFDIGVFGDTTLAIILSRYAYPDLKNVRKIADVYKISFISTKTAIFVLK